MATQLTTPFREKHPDVRFTILSQTSREILAMLDDLQIDAGLTYLDNEPLGQIRTLPLYWERYRLLTSAHLPLGDRDHRDLGGGRADPALPADARHAEPPHHRPPARRRVRRRIRRCSNRIRWSFSPPMCARATGRASSRRPSPRCSASASRLRSIPIVEPQEVQRIGLVLPRREPMPPLTRALVAEASRLALPEDADA